MVRIVMQGHPMTIEERNELQAKEIRAKEQQIEAQQQEIEQLRKFHQSRIDSLVADKDAQVEKIMRMEEGIKKAKQMFKNIEIITSCPETGNERNAMQMAIDGHRLMVALLGGKEE